MSRSPLRALTHLISLEHAWNKSEEMSRSPLRAFVSSLNLEQEEF